MVLIELMVVGLRFRQYLNEYAPFGAFLFLAHTSAHMTLSSWQFQINKLGAKFNRGGGVLWHVKRLMDPNTHNQRD